MISSFYYLPSLYLFILLVIFSVTISWFSVWFIRQKIPRVVRAKGNQVLGNISALISIIYGVLVGLTALYLINNISYTSVAVLNEASAVANIYRDSEWLSVNVKQSFQQKIEKYLVEVINVEWPLMKNDNKINRDGDEIIEELANELRLYPTNTNAELLATRDLLNEIKNLYNARQQRIHMSYDTLNPSIWFVVIIGSILTLAINYLFSMNYYLHVIAVCAVALMASSMIYLLVTLDRPFQGEFGIEPDAFQALLNDMHYHAGAAYPGTTHQPGGAPVAGKRG